MGRLFDKAVSGGHVTTSLMPSGGSDTRIFRQSGKNALKFGGIEDIEKHLMQMTRAAYELTLSKMVNKLYEFIQEDVYNAYSPKWYQRTYTLLDERTVETYVYNNFGKGVAGGIRFNAEPYYENMNLENYIHGNTYFGQLAFQSYLEVITNPMKLPQNPYGFPSFKELHRDSFWYEFTKWAEQNFENLYATSYARVTGYKLDVKASANSPSSKGMNLSSSTSDIQSLHSNTLGIDGADKAFHGTITTESALGEVLSKETH